MKYLLIFIAMTGLFACTQSPKNAGEPLPQTNYKTFKFSDRPAVMDKGNPSNWCDGLFPEAALISADPKNYYRRLFALSNVPNKLVVEIGHMSAALMLKQSGDHVEIYTSENFPACLSNKAFFQISPEGTSFRYDNKREISFEVYLQELPSGIQIALDLPSNGNHGLSVVRCENCK